MAETFYSVLGVDCDAADGDIERAYRERVTECHPDVNDDPEAERAFKRLTEARDVLLDDDERVRYDRLGHERYVRRHVDSNVWTAGRPARTDSGSHSETESQPGRESAAGSEAPAAGRWPGADATPDPERPTERTTAAGPAHSNEGRAVADGYPAARHTASATTAPGFWEVPRTTPTHPEGRPESVSDRVLAVVEQVGVWPAIHVAFVGSALLTGWFVIAQGVVTSLLSVAFVAAWLGVVGAAALLSVLHLVAQLYS
jgi:hypothetical protein